MWRNITIASLMLLAGCKTLEKNNKPFTFLYQGVEFLFSGSIPEEMTVSATGTGSTREEATQNALKEAVQKGVGILVVSDLTITDQKKVSDLLINYSSGFVKEYKTEECSVNKRTTCKITAKVSPWNFRNKTENKKNDLEINGENLIAQHETLKHVIKQRKKLTEYYFSRIRTEGFIGKVDSVEVVPNTGDQVKLNVNYKVIWNENFRNEVITFLTLLEEDTGGGFNDYNTATDVYIQWEPVSWGKSRVYIKPHDEEYKRMMKNYLYDSLAVTIQPFGVCEYFNPEHTIFYFSSGIGNAQIVTSKQELKKAKKIEIAFGCNKD